ncbi:MAG: glycerol-3-phosphate transporter, partial [Acetobacteraceae bacterium]
MSQALPAIAAPDAAASAARARRADWLTHGILILGVFLFALPIWLVLVGSTHDAATIGRGEVPLLPGAEGPANYAAVWTQGDTRRAQVAVSTMMFNSAVMALLITIGKIAISIVSAYAVAFFSFPGRMLCFWAIFITLMLPVEVR